MRFEEIPEWDRYKYHAECPVCRLITNLCTQEDSYPEYRAAVYVQCACGEWLEFHLPVN